MSKVLEFVKFTLCVSKVPFAKSQSPLLLHYFCQVDFTNLGSPYYPLVPSMFQLAVLSHQLFMAKLPGPLNAVGCLKLPKYIKFSGLPIGLPPPKPFSFFLSLSLDLIALSRLRGALSKIKTVFIFLF